MFLRCKVRRKDGKQHRYWSVVENTRVARGRVVQRHVLYLGEINDTQELAWRRSIALEAVNEVKLGRRQLFIALISQTAQRRHGPRKVEIANENARVSEHTKTEVTIGLER